MGFILKNIDIIVKCRGCMIKVKYYLCICVLLVEILIYWKIVYWKKSFDKNEFIKIKFKISFEIVYIDFMC